MRISNQNPFVSVMAVSALILMAGSLPVQASGLDHRIETAARQSYNFKAILNNDSIKIESENGMVTLTGTVSADYHKALAEQTVAGLPGVRGVDNRIVLTGTQPAPASDDWITMKVKSTLAFHKHVSATGTEVSTRGGVVTLTGIANSAAERDLVGEYARDVEGVTDIRNEMSVANPSAQHHETMGEKIDDSSITAQIKTTLLLHKSVRALATKVITRNGNVSVHGEAKTEAEKEKVTRLAEDIKGVKHVNNHMTIINS
jgi:osmotically-inducible protein OsmY